VASITIGILDVGREMKVHAPTRRAASRSLRCRWVIDRTFSWLHRNRHLMAHYEASSGSQLALPRSRCWSGWLRWPL